MPPKPSAGSKAPRKQPQPAAGKSRPKPKAKAPLPVAERVKKLFASLYAQIDGGYFANAVKTCDKILRLEPTDADALQTKLFLLLQTEQYDAALTLIKNMDGQAGAEFARAYSLYRLQREEEAGPILQTLVNDDDRGALHLQAQLNYRQTNYDVSLDLYTQLLDSAEPGTEEHSDILTNLQASQAHLDFITAGYLRALDTLPSGSAAALEAAPPQQPATAAAPATSSAIPTPAPAPAAPKKVRARRVPKGVVPGVTPPPDPERWLKKNERSNYMTGKKRRGAAGYGAGATQGAALDDAPARAPAQAQGKPGGKSKKKK